MPKLKTRGVGKRHVHRGLMCPRLALSCGPEFGHGTLVPADTPAGHAGQQAVSGAVSEAATMPLRSPRHANREHALATAGLVGCAGPSKEGPLTLRLGGSSW